MDREGDIRVLANLAPGEEWLEVLLHEVGHAVYDDHIDRSLPWVLFARWCLVVRFERALYADPGPAGFLTGLAG